MKGFGPGTSRKDLIALLGTMFLAACSGAAQAASYTMFRDPSCGCCEAWAAHIREGLHAGVAVQDSADMGAIKDREGVPDELRSCHTMIVDGYVIEGHVPAADIARLLRERPAGVEGLAVAGMPLGSPGMEMGGRTQPYQVIAFGPSGKRVFASYP
ncbi:metal-binding protein [Novosphingobium sp. PC22D]|nr:metal-binding protein [Novosphingobium sp. PC22D]